jgi:hypothetical protein
VRPVPAARRPRLDSNGCSYHSDLRRNKLDNGLLTFDCVLNLLCVVVPSPIVSVCAEFHPSEPGASKTPLNHSRTLTSHPRSQRINLGMRSCD